MDARTKAIDSAVRNFAGTWQTAAAAYDAGVAAEREQHDQWKRELRQMAEDAAADRGDVFAQRVLRALGPNVRAKRDTTA